MSDDKTWRDPLVQAELDKSHGKIINPALDYGGIANGPGSIHGGSHTPPQSNNVSTTPYQGTGYIGYSPSHDGRHPNNYVSDGSHGANWNRIGFFAWIALACVLGGAIFGAPAVIGIPFLIAGVIILWKVFLWVTDRVIDLVDIIFSFIFSKTGLLLIGLALAFIYGWPQIRVHARNWLPANLSQAMAHDTGKHQRSRVLEVLKQARSQGQTEAPTQGRAFAPSSRNQ